MFSEVEILEHSVFDVSVWTGTMELFRNDDPTASFTRARHNYEPYRTTERLYQVLSGPFSVHPDTVTVKTDRVLKWSITDRIICFIKWGGKHFETL